MQWLQHKEWAWWYLAAAAVFEISWAIGLKKSEGFTRLSPTIFTIITMLLSFVFLSAAVRHMPVGTGYAIWTGAGAVGVAIIGMLWLHEPVSLGRIVSLGLVVVGIVGLKMSSPE